MLNTKKKHLLIVCKCKKMYSSPFIYFFIRALSGLRKKFAENIKKDIKKSKIDVDLQQKEYGTVKYICRLT